MKGSALTSTELDMQAKLDLYKRRDIDALLTIADVTGGRILLDKHVLEKVPHVITGFTFRKGMSPTGFVSVEATALFSGEGFDKGDDVVYNDSSPYGVLGELSAYAAYKGILTGYKGSKTNVPWPKWKINDPARAHVETSTKGKDSLVVTDVVLHARAGLRSSTYQFETEDVTGEATTFYLSQGAPETL